MKSRTWGRRLQLIHSGSLVVMLRTFHILICSTGQGHLSLFSSQLSASLSLPLLRRRSVPSVVPHLATASFSLKPRVSLI